MGTASDLLLASEKVVLTIDSSLRTIVIPPNVKNLGVVSDDDVMRVYFTMPKTYCEIDLSTFAIRINYLNAKGGPDLYKVTDATVEDDQIIFSWLVGRNATAFKGNVTFNVCLKDINEEGLVEREFNTTVTTLPILEGLETDEAVIQDHADYIVQLERELTEHIENTVNEWCGEKLDETIVAQKTSEHVLSKVAEDYVPKTDGVIMSDEVVDNSVAYVKDVPATSPNVAKIHKIGGVTRKCTNLLPYPYTETTKTSYGMTYTDNGDGTLTVNGTSTEQTNFFFAGNEKFSLPVGTYTFSLNYVIPTGTTVWLYKTSESRMITAINAGEQYKTFTLAKEESFNVYIHVSAGVSFPNVVLKPMLNEGSTALPYEPYFVGLRSAPVTEVESVGVNLFDPAPIGTKTFIGLTYTTEDGYVKINGTKANGANVHIMTAPNMTLPAGTYTVSVRMISGTVTGIEASGGVFFGINQNTYGQRTTPGVSKVGDVGVRTFTLSEPTLVSSFDIAPDYASVGAVFDNAVFACQFEQADTATEFKPYTHAVLPIPEAVQALDGYGDGVNESVYNYIDFETKQFVKRVHEVTFNGSEAWIEGGSMEYFKKYYVSVPLPTKAYTECVANLSGGCSAATGELNYYVGGSFNVWTAKYTTVEEFIAHLAENPVTVVYELATPVVTDISDLFQRDNLLPVEANGTVTMVNEYEYEYNVPSEVIFYTDAPEHVSAKEFVGNLSGTAARAERDVEGNLIPTTYVKKGDSLIVDSTNRVKTVPESSASYAKVNEIGGMTRKTKNLWNNAAARLGSERLTRTETGYEFVQSESRGDYVCYSIPLVKGQTVTFSCVSGSYTPHLYLYKEQVYGTNLISVTGGKLTYTALEDLPNATFTVIINSDGVDHEVSNIQVEFGESVSTYEPYFDGLRSVAVTEVKSIGTNLATPQEVYARSARYLETTLDGRAVVRFCASSTIKNEVLKFKENTQYTISGLFKNVKTSDGNSTPNAYASFFYSDGTSTSGTIEQNIDWSHYAFTSTAGKTVVAVGTASYNYTSDVYVDVNTFMLNEGATALPYSPCPYDILPIPEAVQALDGYGCGLSDTLYNYIDLDAKKFVKRVGAIDMDDMVWNYTDYWASPTLQDTVLINHQNPSLLAENYETHAWTGATSGQVTMNGTGYIVIRGDSANIPHGMLYYELATPEVIDISIGDALGVEPGGTVTFVNEYNYDLPNKLTFYTEPNKFRVGSEGFVGDLIGTASRAVCDSEGNDINKTYVKNQSDSFVLKSATKLWRITVNDSGTITATEIT